MISSRKQHIPHGETRRSLSSASDVNSQAPDALSGLDCLLRSCCYERDVSAACGLLVVAVDHFVLGVFDLALSAFLAALVAAA
ncbi:MAG TPA: hypothetical protein VN371_06250, partial [Chlorobaculum sp.]|nr:hypothetical protein [Chlorobaculum sp.]